MLAFNMTGLHTVLAYSKMGRVMTLNVETINSFCLFHSVKVSAFKMLSICFALVMETFISASSDGVEPSIRFCQSKQSDLMLDVVSYIWGTLLGHGPSLFTGYGHQWIYYRDITHTA